MGALCVPKVKDSSSLTRVRDDFNKEELIFNSLNTHTREVLNAFSQKNQKDVSFRRVWQASNLMTLFTLNLNLHNMCIFFTKVCLSQFMSLLTT